MLDSLLQTLIPSKKMIDMFTFKIESNHSVEQIAQKVPMACADHKFSILQTYVYHEILENKGFPIQRKVIIYDICQAKTAAAMLTGFPYFSIFMPCKLAVYEEDNKTVVSTMNMEIMLKAIGSNKELYSDAIFLFNTLKSLMDSLTID